VFYQNISLLNIDLVLYDGTLDETNAKERIRVANQLIDAQILSQDQTLINCKQLTVHDITRSCNAPGKTK